MIRRKRTPKLSLCLITCSSRNSARNQWKYSKWTKKRIKSGWRPVSIPGCLCAMQQSDQPMQVCVLEATWLGLGQVCFGINFGHSYWECNPSRRPLYRCTELRGDNYITFSTWALRLQGIISLAGLFGVVYFYTMFSLVLQCVFMRINGCIKCE